MCVGLHLGVILQKKMSFKLGNLLYKSNFYLLSEGTVQYKHCVKYQNLFANFEGRAVLSHGVYSMYVHCMYLIKVPVPCDGPCNDRESVPAVSVQEGDDSPGLVLETGC